MNEKFTFCLISTIQWNLSKLHATGLTSAKYKTHVVKEQLFMMKICSLAFKKLQR